MFRIQPTDFIRNVFTLISGTAIAQAIPFLMLPVLQRWFFSPAEFGLLAVYISFTGIFATAATLKFEFAIVLARSKEEALHFFSIAVISGISIGILLLTAIVIAGEIIAGALGDFRIYPLLFLAPVSIIAYSVFQSLTYWLNRKDLFKKIAAGKLVQTSSAEGIKLFSGFSGLGASGLVFGRVAGEVAGALFYAIEFVKKNKDSFSSISISRLKQLFKSNKEYPLFTTPSAFVGTLASVAYIFMFSNFYSAEVVGYAGIAAAYIAIPVGIISSSVSQVFLNKISGINLREDLRRIYLQYMLYLSGISFLLIILVYLVPSSWIILLLGDEWTPLLVFIRVFVLWIAVSFISSSLSFIYIKLKRQKIMFIADIVHLIMVVASIAIAHQLYNDAYISIWFFTAAQFIYYCFAILLALLFLRKPGLI